MKKVEMDIITPKFETGRLQVRTSRTSATVGRKSVRHRTENRIKARTELLSN